MTPLDKARAKAKELREQGVKVERKTAIQRAAEDPRSLRKAITAKCHECEGDEDPQVKKRIAECKCSGICSLWHLRPYQHLI